MALDAYALATLAHLKGYLDKTGNIGTRDDSYYNDLINRSSYVIEGWCSRKFLTRTYTEAIRVPYNTLATLNEFPIVQLQGVWSGRTSALSVSNTSASVMSAWVSVTPSKLTLSSLAAATGAQTDTELAFSTYGSTAALATAIAAVSGWTCIKSVDTPAWRLWPGTYNVIGATTGGNTGNVEYAGEVMAADIRDARISTVMVRSISRASTLAVGGWYGQAQLIGEVQGIVRYSAGFDTVPYDVEQACIELAVEMDKPFGASQANNVGGTLLTAEMVRVRSRLGRYIRQGV